jgi:hypothetical protein
MLTRGQKELLLRCIVAAREAQKVKENPSLSEHPWRDLELVEVGRINGVRPETAASLVSAGLLVDDMPSWASEVTHAHVRLPRLEDKELSR